MSNINRPNKKFDAFMIWVVLLFPIAVFIFSPVYAETAGQKEFAEFLDNYLFGHGYYKPDAYPFASKITNSFSLIFAIFAAFIAAVIQGWKKYDFLEKNTIFAGFILVVLLIFFIWTSVVHMEFSTSQGRSFGTKASFYNNYFFYMTAMLSKTVVIYFAIRFILAFLVTFLIEWQEYRAKKK
ncbi:hypothetical protein ACFPVS_11045 [Neisseria weixii]|uniref:hypothetical protein n=1 Tax=Neisseria weixii TaxID=1853276 RepID=UPI003615AA0F